MQALEAGLIEVKVRPVGTEGHSAALPPNFLLAPNFAVPRNICFKHIIKTKILPT